MRINESLLFCITAMTFIIAGAITIVVCNKTYASKCAACMQAATSYSACDENTSCQSNAFEPCAAACQ